MGGNAIALLCSCFRGWKGRFANVVRLPRCRKAWRERTHISRIRPVSIERPRSDNSRIEPAVVDPSRQRKTVHFSGHVDVGKQRVHRKPFQNADGLRGMGRFDDVKSRPTQVGRNLRKATYRFKKEASIPTDAYNGANR
jgi:hypothetical protein